jgi:hypothetical protein
MADQAPRSPFASPSWEPRFVVEHYHPEAMAAAIRLWLLCASWLPAPDPRVSYVARQDTVLHVAHPADRHRSSSLEWSALPEPLDLAGLVPVVLDWLRQALYPPKPWFDGGERAGFCVFWGHYGCEEVAPAVQGSLVVLPKWFEIHK